MKLKRCPFCGGKPVVAWGFIHEKYPHIYCPYCDVSTIYCHTAKEAADIWNRRRFNIINIVNSIKYYVRFHK
jgi:Lar family restriction alleviation protein